MELNFGPLYSKIIDIMEIFAEPSMYISDRNNGMEHARPLKQTWQWNINYVILKISVDI